MPSGTIKRLVRDRGFGFIRDDRGQEWFFHRSAVQNGTFDHLNEGRTSQLRRRALRKGPARRQRKRRSRLTQTGLILFDIDGTLIVTGGAGQRALDRAFEQLFGIPRAFASVELPGRTDPLIVRDALRAHGIADADHDWARFHDSYVDALAARSSAITPPSACCPGSCRCSTALQRARDDRVLALLPGNFDRPPAQARTLRPLALLPWGAFGDDAPDRNGLVPVAVDGDRYGYPRVVTAAIAGDWRHAAGRRVRGRARRAIARGRDRGPRAEQLCDAGADMRVDHDYRIPERSGLRISLRGGPECG